MRPINLSEPVPENTHWYQIKDWPVMMLGFRAFFLGAGIWAVIAATLWLGILQGTLTWASEMPATLWHVHEMIFGFAAAVAIGFLLTAAQNWTGVPSLSGYGLAFLFTVWALTRVTFFLLPESLLLVLLGQITFWLCSTAFIAHMLVTAKAKRNFIMIAVLGLLTLFNSAFLMSCMLGDYMLARTFGQLAVLGFMLLIGIIGGRVIPFFTARGLLLKDQVKTPKLDIIVLLSGVIAIAGFALDTLTSLPIIAGFMMLPAAILHLVRSVIWFNKGVIKVPLLWSLQLGYFASALGMLSLCASYWTNAILFSDALHMITVGGMGLTILAMMARVSLGHTGRALQVPWYISAAFLLLAISTIIRALLPNVIGPHYAWFYSGYLWIAAFVLFLIHYSPILLSKRVDGRRG